MNQKPTFDQTEVHRFYSAQCFNQAWGLIDKCDRTTDEDEEMIRLSQASIWHWTQREDCTPTNMSVGYWQASRIYALLGHADQARKYGRLSLDYSPDDAPFFSGYAHEALARAEMVAGDKDEMNKHIDAARQAAENVPDAKARKMLVDDLNTIK